MTPSACLWCGTVYTPHAFPVACKSCGRQPPAPGLRGIGYMLSERLWGQLGIGPSDVATCRADPYDDVPWTTIVRLARALSVAPARLAMHVGQDVPTDPPAPSPGLW